MNRAVRLETRLFTESARGRFRYRVAMSACLSVCLFVKILRKTFRVSWILLLEGRNANIGMQ